MLCKKKLVVVCSHDPFEGSGGDRTATKLILRSLSKTYQIYLLCRSHSQRQYTMDGIEIETVKYENLITRFCQGILKFKINGFIYGTFYSKKLKKRLDDILDQKNDIEVYVHHPYMLTNISIEKLTKVTCEVHVLDSFVFLQAWKNHKYKIQQLIKYFDLRRSEQKFLHATRKNIFLSEKEVKIYQKNSYLVPLPISNLSLTCYSDYKERENRFVFFGDFAWEPNRQTVMNILNLCNELEERFPSYQVCLVGRNMPPNLVREINKLNNVSYLGFISDLETYLKNSKYLLAPMAIGGGVRLKLIEGICHGMCVFTNKCGVEGLPDVNPCFIIEGVSDIGKFSDLLHNNFEEEIIKLHSKRISFLEEWSKPSRVEILSE